MNQPCRSFAADLDLLAAGVLPLERISAVEAHLDGCTTCHGRYERTVMLCAELSTAGKADEASQAAAWRLRRGVRAAITAPVAGVGRRWRTATALAVGLACAVLIFHRAAPPDRPPLLAEVFSTTPISDPPLTLLACERAAARSDAAFDQMLSRDAARAHTAPGEESLRAFSLIAFATLDHEDHLP